jgi:ribosomal protein S18 acetylase RimI-like enzyme
MTRPHFVVRPAELTDSREIVELWAAHRVESGVTGEGAARRALEGRVDVLLERGDVHVFIAYADDVAVGYILITDVTPSPLSEHSSISIDQLYVRKGQRRLGAARQLLTAATTYAERAGVEQVVTNVPSQGREANRFFARLGFTPTVVRRVTPTAALLRKLAGGEPRYSVDQLLQRRRRARLHGAAQTPTVAPR